MAINPDDLPKIRQLIDELNNIAHTRKTMLDQLWTLENHTELLRRKLMELLEHPQGGQNVTISTNSRKTKPQD